MKAVQLSIIIPVYNAEKYLRQCLDSVLGQDVDTLEVVAVDDGSTDSSGAILDEYAVKDPRIKVLHQENASCGYARNAGVDLAVGDYILFLDADDFLYSGKLLPALECAVANNADMAEFCCDHYNDKTGEIITPHDVFYAERPPINQVFSWQDDPENFVLKFKICVHTKIFRRRFLLDSEIRFKAMRSCEDYAYLLSHMLIAKRIVFSDIKLMLYRIGTGVSMEDKIEAAPLYRLLATRDLYDFAVSLPYYDQVKRGVCSMNAILNTSFLTTCKSAAVFRTYYGALKDGGLARLGLTGLPKGYIVSPTADHAIRRILRGNPIMPKNARHLLFWKALTFTAGYAYAVFGAFKHGGFSETFRRIRAAKSRV